MRPAPGGLAVDSNDAFSRFTAHTETSQRTGTSVGVRGALAMGDAAALGGGLQLGGNSSELFVNLGMRVNNSQRLMFTAGQLRQKPDFNFPSGNTRAEVTQNSAGASWRLSLGNGLLDYAEANAYAARTASRDLNDVNYAVDTAALYELWNDPRRIAGGTLDGVQGKLGLRPWEGGRASLGFGQERLRYDLLGGAENHNRATGSLGLEQAIDAQTRLKFGADAAAAQNRTYLGLDHRFGGVGTLGMALVNIRGRDGAPNDNRLQLSWTVPLGKGAGVPRAAVPMAGRREGAAVIGGMHAHPELPPRSPGSDGLLDQVATRPAWMPAQVIAKLDTTTGPTRLIAVDKTALPAGASVNPTTGAVAAPLGVAVAGIVGVTRNGISFANTGQFALSGGSLIINPGLITQPAVGVVDVYVVTADNVDGGTTLITVNVSHGSVRIDSIVVAVISPAPAVAADDTNNLIVLGADAVAANLEVSVDTGTYAAYSATATYPGNPTVKVRVKAMNGNRAGYDTTLVFTEVTPGTPVAIADDTNNLIVLGTGAVAANLEVSVDAGAYVAYSAATTYAGNHAITLHVKAMNGNPPGAAATLAFTEIAPAAPSVTANDASDVVVLGAGAVAANLEVSLDGGAYAAYNVASTYPGDRTVKVRVKAMNGNPVGAVTTLYFMNPAPPPPPPPAAAAPTASAVSIAGTAQVGQVLTGSYTYADANNDAQGTSTFRWLRNGVAIGGATASTYTLVLADQGNTITFEVTPVSTVAPTTGSAVVSGATAAVAGAAAAPTASAVSIAGTAQVGQVLTGSYTFADANNDAQGTSTFRWLRNGVAIGGATASTYTLVNADYGNTITFEVTPVATVAPTTGTAVASAATAAITLPAGYVSQGGLTWMPNNIMPPNGWATWPNADAYCTGTTILGQTGWRLPTTAELSALYASGAIAAQGWTLNYTWSSTPRGAGVHEFVSLDDGGVGWGDDADDDYVSCVR